MTAAQFYHQECPKDEFLAKAAIIALLDKYADHRFEEQRHKRDKFQTEQWMATTNSRVGRRIDPKK